MRVYFTRPIDPNVATGSQAIYLPGTAADTVIELIHRAKKSIDLAIYNMNIDGIAYALNQAKVRGVRVRVIYDGSTTNSSIYVLQGVPILASPTSSSYGIMHNKFMVIDCDTDDPNDAILFTGSMNFTSTQVNKDANNILIIQDRSLALAYRMEFEEMWGGSGNQPNPSASRFGPFKKNNTPHYFNVGGIPIESWFSPSDGVNSKILAAINSANTSLFIPTNLITRDDLANAIEKRRQNGVLCRVVVDDDASCSDQVVATLTQALGTNFRETTESGILHHKVLIADALQTNSNPVVLTGSHNWSNNAEIRNDENTLILYDASIANLYYQEFSQRFKQSRVIAPNPMLDLGPDISVCAGQKVILDAGTGFFSYLWSNGSTASQIIVDTSGMGLGSITLSCTVNNVYGTQTDQITITFFTCTSIEDNLTKRQFSIYPNPTREFFRMQLPPDVKPQFIEVYGIQGQMVMRQTTRLVGDSLEINVSELNAGIYMVRVLAGNKVYVARLLKQ
jgi:phosphatidylserine/phosphatidylglycerophosphate/cardiolipin synthase-like enzyme